MVMDGVVVVVVVIIKVMDGVIRCSGGCSNYGDGWGSGDYGDVYGGDNGRINCD